MWQNPLQIALVFEPHIPRLEEHDDLRTHVGHTGIRHCTHLIKRTTDLFVAPVDPLATLTGFKQEIDHRSVRGKLAPGGCRLHAATCPDLVTRLHAAPVPWFENAVSG